MDGVGEVLDPNVHNSVMTGQSRNLSNLKGEGKRVPGEYEDCLRIECITDLVI